jgi:hypothetical protein
LNAENLANQILALSAAERLTVLALLGQPAARETGVRRQLRDEALRSLAALHPELRRRPRAEKICSELRRYAATSWKADQAFAELPQTASMKRQWQHIVLKNNDGQVLGSRRIFDLL